MEIPSGEGDYPLLLTATNRHRAWSSIRWSPGEGLAAHEYNGISLHCPSERPLSSTIQANEMEREKKSETEVVNNKKKER